jgi:hypothetical protein
VNDVQSTWGASTTLSVDVEEPQTLCSGRKHDYYGDPLSQHDSVVDVALGFTTGDDSLAFAVPLSARLDENTEFAEFEYHSEQLPSAEFEARFGITPRGSCATLDVVLWPSQGWITVHAADCDAQCLVLEGPMHTQTWHWFTGNPDPPGETL